MIDLRSDTVTKPTEGMRRAMYEAEVGDDVFGEDPTVIQLQETVAEILGKEAGLFVPTGVMGNQLALKTHTNPADEVILEANCHIFNYESAASGVLSGIQLRTLEGNDGIITASQVEGAIRTKNYWDPVTRLVCLENTHNKAGGIIYPLEHIKAIGAVVKKNSLKFHLDGARLWNASIATGIAEATFAHAFDTINVCLSKGLGAPMGSVLVGSRESIKQAHRYRKMFGGGMRQIGIIAAAGLYALKNHRETLRADHEHAKMLAMGLATMKAFHINPDKVQTNIVMFDVISADVFDVLNQLKGLGVLMVPFGPKTIRATFHREVSKEDVEQVISKMLSAFG